MLNQLKKIFRDNKRAGLSDEEDHRSILLFSYVDFNNQKVWSNRTPFRD